MKTKKVVGIALAVGLGVLALKSARGVNGLFHSLRHDAQDVTAWVESQVPMEKKFAQLRRDAGEIDGEMEKVKNELAREIVEVRDLKDRAAELRAAVETNDKTLTARGKVIDDAAEHVSFNGRKVSKADALAQYTRDVKVFAMNRKQLAAMEATLASREAIKETLVKTLDGMKSKKGEVLAAIDEAEAEYKQLQLTAVESKYQADDTKLARIKENLRSLKKKIAIEREKQNLTPVVLEEAAAAPTKSAAEMLAAAKGEAVPPAVGEAD